MPGSNWIFGQTIQIATSSKSIKKGDFAKLDNQLNSTKNGKTLMKLYIQRNDVVKLYESLPLSYNEAISLVRLGRVAA